eukprot:3047703-Amphidinium_carterae.2
MNPTKLKQELEGKSSYTAVVLSWVPGVLEPPLVGYSGQEGQLHILSGSRHNRVTSMDLDRSTSLEVKYLVKSNVVETILRVELADPSTNIISGFIIERALKLGYNTTESLLFLTFRELQTSGLEQDCHH